MYFIEKSQYVIIMQAAFLYNDIYRKSSFGEKHPITPKRISNVYDLANIMKFKDSLTFIHNQIASEEELSLFHDKNYIKVLKQTESTQKISKEDSKKYNLGTIDNPIFTEMYKRHATSTGSMVLASELITQKYNYIFSPAAGAHHGKYNKASGFCYFNDIVTGIIILKKKGFKRILYFDMDAHYGDGVIEHFKKDKDVFTISIHEEGLWPRTGNYEYDLKNNLINYPVKPGFNDKDFLNLFKKDIFLSNVRRFNPQIVLLQMGADCLKEDHMSKLELSNNAMMFLIKEIKKISKKIILMGGGGYNPWICLRAWIYNLATLINRIDLLKLNSESKYFLKSLKWKKEPKQEWITSIIDYPNIFN